MVPSTTSYDEVPYADRVHPATHPDLLAVVATLYGMDPAPPDRCRVLELGCAAGGNLIALAETLPGSRFVGIDLSAPDRCRAAEGPGARIDQRRAPCDEPRRYRGGLRAIRLHPQPRRLLVGARRGPRCDPGHFLRQPDAAGRRLRELQLLSRLARPRRGAGDDVLPRRPLRRPAIACGKPGSSSVSWPAPSANRRPASAGASPKRPICSTGCRTITCTTNTWTR